MSKNILVISTSPRKNGNTETLADAFIRGAKEAGNEVEKVCLYDKTVGFCKGWIACFPKAHLAGNVFGGGADAAGAIHGHPALDKAYEMGKAI